MGDSFVHLHCHTEYSILDGASKINEMVAAAKADGQPAIATTDHGNVYSLIEFYKECHAQGINPILGTEAYLSSTSRFDRTSHKRKKVDKLGDEVDEGGHKMYYHITLLAENNTGYHNLLKISSDAYLNGYYFKPRTDLEFLSRHSEGMIATTGCLGGLVLQQLMAGNYDKGKAYAAQLQDIFGRDNLFVELQDHGIPEQIKTNPMLIKIAKEIGAPLVLTNDSHYTKHSDSHAHDSLLCIQTGAMIADENRFKFESDQHYIKSAAEMRSLFSDHIDACDNTLWIAERANVEIALGEPHLPVFPLPDGYSSPLQYLTELVFRGLSDRDWGNDGLSDEIVGRLRHELGVIGEMGFSSYFLIVWDLVAHARSAGIGVGPGRGSVGGSLVAYALGITQVNPLEYGLIFERFLNPSRISMPDMFDFDIEFDDIHSNTRELFYGYQTGYGTVSKWFLGDPSSKPPVPQAESGVLPS